MIEIVRILRENIEIIGMLYQIRSNLHIILTNRTVLKNGNKYKSIDNNKKGKKEKKGKRNIIEIVKYN